ncbi:MAG: ABC transporter ATP-binding protein [Clostridia bacterium]|nr:ABC transporter ATP-binding protein [Clostridia bacterium]MBO4886052.1 ABC transporter ATP-binding protein [Clostridia bacterium]MBR4442417.1 ABC transporter ATP-binding protein [Clostridia bacterium]
MENDVVLEVKGLNLFNRAGDRLVENVSLSLRAGETLGLVGESGSGKTLTLKSLIGLLPPGVSETHESRLDNPNCAMIFQNPLSALDPLCPVFRQLCEVIAARQGADAQTARARASQLLSRLSLPEELAVRDRFPGSLSGGQCQRLLIAMALACRPDVLLCDEPTTALDVTVQKQTIELIRSLQRELGFAIVFVTHNLAVAAQLCERLAVMRQGRVIESGPTREVLTSPREEYTRTLIGAVLPVPEMEA